MILRFLTLGYRWKLIPILSSRIFSGLSISEGSPKFHTPQFDTSVQNKRATPFQPPKFLSSTPDTPQLNTENPSVQHTLQFNTLLVQHGKLLISTHRSVYHRKPLSSTHPSVQYRKPLSSTHPLILHRKPLSSTHSLVQHQKLLSSAPKTHQSNKLLGVELRGCWY